MSNTVPIKTKADNTISMPCRRCGQTAGQLMAMAMLEYMGCSVSPSSTKCWDGKEHDFTQPKEIEKP